MLLLVALRRQRIFFMDKYMLIKYSVSNSLRPPVLPMDTHLVALEQGLDPLFLLGSF